MKLLRPYIFLSLIIAAACSDDLSQDFEPETPVIDDCDFYIPFYEQQSTDATTLWVQCLCQDKSIDLGMNLAPYTSVEKLNFGCNASKFNLIPTMPSVKELTSEVSTANIIAFPNLEVYKNNTLLEGGLTPHIIFLPKLREVSLYNPSTIHSTISTKPLDVFKITFQNTASKDISLPDKLNTLSNLKELFIRDITLASFTNFDGLIGLERLILSNVLWVRIPSVSNLWPKLKFLDVSQVELRGNIPDVFREMDSLQTININNTRLTSTSQMNIFNAPKLRKLKFSSCELEPIPETIGNLTSLEELIISIDHNNTSSIISLPSSLGNLKNLKSIFVNINSYEFPSSLLGLNNTIESIALQFNIGTVPPEIGGFNALKILRLNNCGLSSLPSEIQNLASSLDQLHLLNNNFDEATKQTIKSSLPNTEIFF